MAKSGFSCLAIAVGLMAGAATSHASDQQRIEQWGPGTSAAIATSLSDSWRSDAAGLWGGPQGLSPRAPASQPPPQDATWRLSPPPRGSMYAAAVDGLHDRLVVVAPDGAIWTLPLAGPGQAWRQVEALGQRPDALQYSVADPTGDRILCLASHPKIPGAVTAFALELSNAPRWIELDDGRGEFPGPRRDFSVALDTQRRRLLLFGGWYRDLLDDVWTFDLGTRRWTKHAPAGEGPGPRISASIVYDPGSDCFVVHGGSVETQPRLLSSTDELWSLSGDARRWTRLGVVDSALGPGPRSRHRGLYDAGSGCVLYFVTPRDSSERKVVYGLVPGDPPAWRRFDPPGADARSRNGAVAAYDPARDLYLLAGGTTGLDLVDVDVFALRPTPAWAAWRGWPTPPGRLGHIMALDPIGQRFIAFGGIGESSQYRNDVWTAAIDTPEVWQEVPTSEPAPSPRSEAVGIYDPVRRRLVVHGGWRYPDVYPNDTWLLDVSTGEWTPAATQGEPPSGRRGPAAILDPARDRMVYFGGYDGVPRGDVWELRLSDLRWQRLVGDDVGPDGRLFASATHDPLRDRMLVYGGSCDDGSSSELWSIDLETYEWTLLASSPYLGSSRHTAVHDPEDDRLLIHGGFSGHGDVVFIHSWTLAVDLRGDPAPNQLRTNRITATGHATVFDSRGDRLVVTGGSDLGFYPSTRTALLELDRTSASAWLLYMVAGTGDLHMAWQIADGPGTAARIERRGIGGDWVPLVDRVADDAGRIEFTDDQLRPGWRYDYRVVVGDGVASSPARVDIEGDPPLRLFGAWPNPARGSDIRLELAVVAAAAAHLELFDVQGRRVVSETFRPSTSGIQQHRIGAPLHPGVYLARLEQRGAVASCKLVVLGVP